MTKTLGPSQKATYRTVHEVLEETTRIVEASAEGLAKLAKNNILTERERLMLEALASTRTSSVRHLSAVRDSAPRHGEETWLQYAPIFSACPSLALRISKASSGQAAYDLVDEADLEVERLLDCLSYASCSCGLLLSQVRQVIHHLRATSHTTVMTSVDI